MTDEEGVQYYTSKFKNLAYTVDYLHKAMVRQGRETEGDYRLLPMIGIVSVDEVLFTSSWRKSNLTLKVSALRGDFRLDTLVYEHEDVAPDYSSPDPGHFEYTVTWENLDDEGRPIAWEHFWTAVRLERGAHEKPPYEGEVEARTRKMYALYHTLRNVVRCRIVHNAELQINGAQRNQAHRRLSLALLGLKEHDPVWTTLMKST